MVSLAALAALLCGGSTLGQQRAGAPPGGPQAPARDPQGAARPQSPSPAPTYRPATPPPLPTTNAGRVLYFQKPADALSATGADGSRDLALASGTAQPLPESPALPPLNYSPPSRTVELPPVTELPAVPGQTRIAFPQPPEKGQPDPKNPGGSMQARPVPKRLPSGVVCDDNPERRPRTPIPSPAAIFIMYNDVQLENAIVESLRIENEKLDPTTRFPLLPCDVYTAGTYVSKTAGYQPRVQFYAPNYVVHRRLHFEEKNSERYGWDLGPIQPFVSTALFYKDVALWPNSLVTGVIRGPWDTSAGKCLPGSPTPYYLYPPGLTIGGTVFEAGLITALSFIP